MLSNQKKVHPKQKASGLFFFLSRCRRPENGDSENERLSLWLKTQDKSLKVEAFAAARVRMRLSRQMQPMLKRLGHGILGDRAHFR